RKSSIRGRGSCAQACSKRSQIASIRFFSSRFRAAVAEVVAVCIVILPSSRGLETTFVLPFGHYGRFSPQFPRSCILQASSRQCRGGLDRPADREVLGIAR